MPAVRIAREASTGLTTNLGGSAASPVAGPNNWSAQVNDFIRISGGGFQGTQSGGFNVVQIDLGAPLMKVSWEIDDPAAAIAAGDTNQGVVEFGLATGWTDSVKYTARPFTASGSNYLVFSRNGAGSNSGDDEFLNCTTLNSAVPWRFTVERTSATTFDLSATDGGTPVTATFTDTGDTARPSGNILSYTQRFTNFITLDLDMYIDASGITGSGASTLPAQTASGTGTVTAAPASVTLVAPLANTGYRLRSIPDLADGDIVQYEIVAGTGSLTVNPDGSFVAGIGVTHFRYRIDDGGGFGAWITDEVAPATVRPAVQLRMPAITASGTGTVS